MKFLCSRLLGAFTLPLALSFFCASSSLAQTKTQDCTRLWQLEKEAGCPAMPADFGLTAQGQTGVMPQKDYVYAKKNFGPSKCVTNDDVDSTVENLEDKCDKWTDKKVAEMKRTNPHIAGVCNHECTPCPKNEVLQKCTVTGELINRGDAVP